MSNVRYPFLLLVLILFTSQAMAQIEMKDMVNIQVGAGAGLYTYSTNQIGDKDGNALTGSFRFAADFGFMPRLTAGVSIFRNGFASDKDSNQSVSNFGGGIYANVFFGGGFNRMMYLTGGLGLTTLNYEDYRNSGKASTGGYYLFCGAGIRQFFGSNFGIFAECDLTTYQYRSLEYSDGTGGKQKNANWEMGISGVEVKAGIIVAIGSSKSKSNSSSGQ